MREDIKDLQYSWQNETIFTFHIVGKAKKVSEIADEMVDISRTLMKVTEDFFIPTQINYILVTFSHDAPPSSIEEYRGSTGIFNREIVDEDGVSIDTLKKDIYSISIPEGHIRYITDMLDFNGRTKFVFKDGEEYIDGIMETITRHDNGVKIFEKERLARLLWMNIMHWPYKGREYATPDDPAFYLIKFWTIAGVYAEDDEVGIANRKLLRSVFKKLFDSFDVIDVWYDSDRFSDECLDSIVYGGGLFPD